MKKIGIVLICMLLMGCSTEKTTSKQETSVTNKQISKQKDREDLIVMEENLVLFINGNIVNVTWEDNESVHALLEIVKINGSMEVLCERYGGFEQVGQLPCGSIVSSDVQTTTQAGDIVLYSGNSLVVFYGSNTWAYTRLGHINDLSKVELEALLGSEHVTVTLSLDL